MQIKDYPFSKLPFSKLFKTYVTDFEKLDTFYETNPFSIQKIEDRASSFSFQGDRDRSSEILREINERYQPHDNALKNIERLKEDESLTIVTGQQLGVFGGPLYTILKTISTIHLSRKMEENLGRPVIPVFWLADEDHDYQEVQSITLLDGDDAKICLLSDRQKNIPPVADLTFSDDLGTLKEEVKQILYETDFSDELWSVLDGSYEVGKRFDHAFGDLIARFFSKHGLVLAGSNHPVVKEHTKDCMKLAIEQADEMRKSLDEKTKELSTDYHQQVTLYDSNLFYLDEETGRQKISRNGDGWKTDSGIEWKTGELIEAVDADPMKFSPNVFLRPIMQDKFLPTLGYVAGPGETAYYGQMKSFYALFNLKMPVVFPRLSASMIEPAIDRIIDELPFEIHEYDKRIEDLESDFVDRTEQVDIEGIFSEWKERIEELSASQTESIKEVDPTLEGAAGKATSVYMGELDKLKGKVYRSVKQQEQTQLNRIQKIKAYLFPNGGLQERTIAGIYFMNKYGVDIWDDVLEALPADEKFNSHKLITL